jgi:hypothetical protein
MVGGKRKRAVSGSENLSTGRFSDAPRMKRQRSEASSQVSSDDGGDQPPASEMDVDEASPRSMPSPGESDDEIDPCALFYVFQQTHPLTHLQPTSIGSTRPKLDTSVVSVKKNS